KAMLKRLVAGEFNELAERLSATHYDPGVLADGTNTASYVNTDPSAPAAAKTYAKKPAPAKPVTPIAKPAAKPQQPVWQPSPPAASPRTPGQPLPAVTRAPAQPTRPSAPPRMTPVTPPPAVRPAAARPASVFSDAPVEAPHDDLPTLFAEELIS